MLKKCNYFHFLIKDPQCDQLKCFIMNDKGYLVTSYSIGPNSHITSIVSDFSYFIHNIV